MAKKKSLFEQYILHSVWMATNYNRVLVLKAREEIVKDENGRIVRKYKKGKKLPKFRPGDRDNY